MNYTYKQLTPHDLREIKELLKVFGEAFNDLATYQSATPSDTYFQSLLAESNTIVLVAENEGVVIGGLIAYELKKFEQDRREIYIYDLAVSAEHRRKGVATALIKKLKEVAAARNASIIFVQADVEDAPAISLYESMGVKEKVYQFDISVDD